ncbi:MAG: aspartate aminotransferase family protein [Anaerolineales bacterium]|nr:aspartate aminotransferase family protein [Anaerolineales bacterium]
MKPDQIIQGESKYIVQTYVRPSMVFTHGKGAYLYDADGKSYLDFSSGIAVTSLGHSDDEWAKAVAEQAGRLAHVSNLYHTAEHVELAQRLIENSFADKLFYCNSGSEANETALKFARKWAKKQDTDKIEIVTFTHSFHGRTMGALSVTAKDKYRAPFAPLVPGVKFAPFNDLEAVKKIVDEKTCAVIVEPVQGEGGVHPTMPDFLEGLRQLCDQNNALLIFDEIQCGLGRTGYLWAHQAYGVTPDIMTLAKPLAGGLPIAVTMVTERVAEVMQPGDHGSTFAAGPLVCKAGQVVFDRISQPQFLAAVRENGAYLLDQLKNLKTDSLVEARGAGLLLGVEFSKPVKPIVAAAAKLGLIVIVAGENVLRLAPPLIVTKQQIDEAVHILNQCLVDF